jgi:peptidoglycan/xylan/chitin deacetylase (PgdA/CDA1 family)
VVAEAVPVLMYHSIAPEITDWAFSYLSTAPEIFEDQIATLQRSGFNTVSLPELYEYVAGRRRLPPKALVITFDDGYLDNWVFAFPILKKYGFKATVFISTDFVDPAEGERPTLDDVWHGASENEDLFWKGFLREGEMRRMLASDLIDIQGHCKTHTWYFVSDRIEDFHHPGDAYPWLAWNERPDRKYLYLEEDQSQFVPFGSPVYEHGKALVSRRYFPDPGVGKSLADHVDHHGGVDFFNRPEWRDELVRLSREVASAGLSDRLENERERSTRLKEEILLSKQELERMLGRQVDFLCWPGGGYDDAAVALAREAGFKAWTLGSRDTGPKRNRPGEDPMWIRRAAATPWWFYRGRRVCAVDGEFLKHIIATYKGFRLAGLRFKWYKLSKLLGSYLR